jgi:hypothetical protein
MTARVAVQAGGDTPVPVEVRIGWVRCERCQRVFTAVGDHHDDLDDLTEEDREALRSLQEDDSEEGGVDEDLDESEDESEDDSESLGDDLDDDLPEEALDLSHADDDEDEPVAAAPKQEANGSVAKKATRSAKGKSAKSK